MAEKHLLIGKVSCSAKAHSIPILKIFELAH